MAQVRVEGLSDGEVRVVPYSDGKPPKRSIIVMRRGERIVAFWNVCQHLPIPLDGGTGTIDRDDTGRLLCNTHGAVYEPFSGHCVEGPCQGLVLEPVKAAWDGDVAVLEP